MPTQEFQDTREACEQTQRLVVASREALAEIEELLCRADDAIERSRLLLNSIAEGAAPWRGGPAGLMPASRA